MQPVVPAEVRALRAVFQQLTPTRGKGERVPYEGCRARSSAICRSAAKTCGHTPSGAFWGILYNRRTYLITEAKLATQQELSKFLAEVERRAFKHAMFAVRDESVALDVVQDAMMKLAEKYGGKPPAEFPMLFQRILQNTIHDFFRRQKVRSTWTTLFSSMSSQDDNDDEQDPLETLEAGEDSNISPNPQKQLEQAQIVALIEDAIARLPTRQREAFLLRYWEDMDVAETASVMGCSEGSVKTHCSRAVHALAEVLKGKGVTL